MAHSYYTWDPDMFPELSQKKCLSYQQARHNFEMLKTIAVDNISPKIIELGNLLVEEALDADYSDVFIRTYQNTANYIALQHHKAVIALPTPPSQHFETMEILRPLCAKLGLVLYDNDENDGAIFFPDGSILPEHVATITTLFDNIAKAVSKQSVQYQENSLFPRKRQLFLQLIRPFIEDCLTPFGFEYNEAISQTYHNKYTLGYYSKKTEFGFINLQFHVSGTMSNFSLNLFSYYEVPRLNEIYSQIYPPYFYLTNCILKINELNKMLFNTQHKVIVEDFIPNLEKVVQRLDKINSYNDLFEHLQSHRRNSIEDIDIYLILAKLAQRPDFEEIKEKYHQTVLKDNRTYRLRSNWQKILEVLDTVSIKLHIIQHDR